MEFIALHDQLFSILKYSSEIFIEHPSLLFTDQNWLKLGAVGYSFYQIGKWDLLRRDYNHPTLR